MPLCGAHAILFLSSTEQNPNRVQHRIANFLHDWMIMLHYLKSYPENSPFMEGWKLDQSQIPNDAVVDAEKLRELKGRVTGLELEAKNCNTNSGTSCVNVKVMVIAFVFGIMISNFV
ncbi:hypothetical protein AHAS_Ahas20G0027200 [Arachis hypogaea]